MKTPRRPIELLGFFGLTLLLGSCGNPLSQFTTKLTVSVSAPTQLTAGTCGSSHAIELTLMAVDGTTAIVASVDTVVSPTLSNGGSPLNTADFYSDPTCQDSSLSFTVKAGSTKVTLYPKVKLAGSPSFAFASTQLSVAGTWTPTVTAATLGGLKWKTYPGILTTQVANAVFTSNPAVQFTDAYGNEITDTCCSVQLTAYTDGTCTTVVPSTGVAPALYGTLSAGTNPISTPANGLATFSNVRFNNFGTIYLKTSVSGTTSSYTSPCLGPFTVLP